MEEDHSEKKLVCVESKSEQSSVVGEVVVASLVLMKSLTTGRTKEATIAGYHRDLFENKSSYGAVIKFPCLDSSCGELEHIKEAKPSDSDDKVGLSVASIAKSFVIPAGV